MKLLLRLAYAFWQPILISVIAAYHFRPLDFEAQAFIAFSWLVSISIFAVSFLSEDTQRLLAKCLLGLIVATFVAAVFYFKKPEPRRSYSSTGTEQEESPAAIEKASREAADQWDNARR